MPFRQTPAEINAPSHLLDARPVGKPVDVYDRTFYRVKQMGPLLACSNVCQQVCLAGHVTLGKNDKKMSYFMIATGGKPDFTSIPQIEALPIAQAQVYLQRLVPKLVSNGMESSIWFIHDGETGTSHNIIQSSVEQMQMESKPLSETNLGKVIKACENVKASFRIWWADGEFEMARCTSIDAVISTIIKQVSNGADIEVKYDCGQPTAAADGCHSTVEPMDNTPPLQSQNVG